MFIIVMFAIMLVWHYFALRMGNPLVTVAMIVLGLMVPMGALAFAFNLVYFLITHKKAINA